MREFGEGDVGAGWGWQLFFFLLILGGFGGECELGLVLIILSLGVGLSFLLDWFELIGIFFIFFSATLGDNLNTRGDFGLAECGGVT